MLQNMSLQALKSVQTAGFTNVFAGIKKRRETDV